MRQRIIRRFVISAILASTCIFLAAQDAPPAPHPASNALKLTLTFSPGHDLLVVFQNDSKKPLVLNLGDMLGNGNALFPTHVEIVASDFQHTIHQFSKGRSSVGGRVDDWLVPFAPRDSYTLVLSPDDLKDEKTRDAFKFQAGARFTAHFQGVDPKKNGNVIPALPIWKGTVESAAVDLPALP